MELSPRLLRDVEFGEQWRGYNQAEVDEFLERVAVALDSLVVRFQETTARAEAAERRLLDRGDDDEIRRTLVLAQRTAAAALDEARAEAERLVAGADAKAAETLADAERKLREIEQEITRRTREELDGLEARRDALLRDIDALSAFVDEHRNHLAGELRRELAWLERPELEVPTPPALQAESLPTSTPEVVIAAEPVAAAPAEAEPDAEAVADEAPPAPEVAAAEAQLAEAAADAEPDGDDPLPGSDDLAAAREELERALAGMPEPEPETEVEPEGDASPGRQIFDVLADDPDPEPGLEPVGPTTGPFDALGADDEVDDLRWREERPIPSGDTDDPFLAELRKAITDDDPLGPRDEHEGFGDDGGSEPAGSGWFRRRRG